MYLKMFQVKSSKRVTFAENPSRIEVRWAQQVSENHQTVGGLLSPSAHLSSSSLESDKPEAALAGSAHRRKQICEFCLPHVMEWCHVSCCMIMAIVTNIQIQQSFFYTRKMWPSPVIHYCLALILAKFSHFRIIWAMLVIAAGCPGGWSLLILSGAELCQSQREREWHNWQNSTSLSAFSGWCLDPNSGSMWSHNKLGPDTLLRRNSKKLLTSKDWSRCSVNLNLPCWTRHFCGCFTNRG